MTGPKLNEGNMIAGERNGTKASAMYLRVSASKARVVLNLIRGLPVKRADEVLQFSDREVSNDIRKVLASAVANAQHNDEQDPEELFVKACFADEGPTLKRFTPRARGRGNRINKRTCHITIVIARLDDARLEIVQAREAKRTPPVVAVRQQAVLPPAAGHESSAAVSVPPRHEVARSETPKTSRNRQPRTSPTPTSCRPVLMPRSKTMLSPMATRSRATPTRCCTTCLAHGSTTRPSPRCGSTPPRTPKPPAINCPPANEKTTTTTMRTTSPPVSEGRRRRSETEAADTPKPSDDEGAE